MRVLMLVAPVDFRDEELFVTKARLEQAGIVVEVAAKEMGTAFGSQGGKIGVDRDYNDVIMKDYDALVIVGGGGALVYKGDQRVKALLSYFRDNKIIGAICIAPTILVATNLFNDYRMTVHPSGVSDLHKHGIEVVDQPVVIDRNLITANGPLAAEKFGQNLVMQLIGDTHGM